MTIEMIVVLTCCCVLGWFCGWMSALASFYLARSGGGIFDSRQAHVLITLAAAGAAAADALYVFGQCPPAIAVAASCLAVSFWFLPKQWADISIQKLVTLLYDHNGHPRWSDGRWDAANCSYQTATCVYHTKEWNLAAQAAREGIRTILAPQVSLSARPGTKKARRKACPEQFKSHNRIAKYLQD